METTLEVNSELLAAARDLFCYPEPGTMQENLNEMIRIMQWGNSRNIPGIVKIIDEIEQGRLNWEALQIDYTRLFINSFPQTKAQPFAGWYLGDTELFGDQERKMRSFYADYGVYMDEEMTAPADHIMVELEFAALLLDSYEKTGDAKLYLALHELIDDHMSRWIPPFAKEIGLYAESDFYRIVADIIMSLLLALQKEMKEVA
ncbi:MAG TPA: molecular chaperone TorD family protein [Syntrophomonas sp.]|nr:molecular chaperone TorD family protein [Syntrophomonas sp.]